MPLSYGKVILLGDSITEFSAQSSDGLAPRLLSYYVRRLDVLNRGYAGYNSSHLVRILPEILAVEQNVQLIIIFIGTNDATLMRDAKGVIQAVPLAQYKRNLASLVEMCTEKDIAPILVGPALHDSTLSRKCLRSADRPTETGWSSLQQNLEYSRACKQIATAKSIPFVDLWDAFRNALGWNIEHVLGGEALVGSLLSDGIHFTAKGNKILSDLVISAIETNYCHLRAEALPLKLAYYGDIDLKNLDSIFHLQSA